MRETGAEYVVIDGRNALSSAQKLHHVYHVFRTEFLPLLKVSYHALIFRNTPEPTPRPKLSIIL